MSDFREQCESSFYRELYHIEGKNQRILLNTVTGRQYLEKTLDVYDLRVYEFLRVNKNIHIPAVESCTVRYGKLVVLEDYVNGETLTNALRRGLPEPERRRVVLEVCDALQFLHAANPPIIHRDVKADNIILTPDGVVKLIDYDAATVFDPTKNADTVLMGTPGAAAPEQYGFARSDARTDIFALGVLIKQILPNDAEYIAAADVATRMDPNARWQSVEEMKNALTHQKSSGKSAWFRPFREASLLKKIIYFLLIGLIILMTLTLSAPSEELALFRTMWLYQVMYVMILLGWLEIGFDMSGLVRKLIPQKYIGKKAVGIKFAIGAVYMFVIAFAVGIVQQFL